MSDGFCEIICGSGGGGGAACIQVCKALQQASQDNECASQISNVAANDPVKFEEMAFASGNILEALSIIISSSNSSEALAFLPQVNDFGLPDACREVKFMDVADGERVLSSLRCPAGGRPPFFANGAMLASQMRRKFHSRTCK
jgi:hypothetical protein